MQQDITQIIRRVFDAACRQLGEDGRQFCNMAESYITELEKELLKLKNKKDEMEEA